MVWKLCIICHKTRERLQCPSTSKEKDIGASDVSFARHSEEFYKIGSVPRQLNVEELNHGQETKHTLKERNSLCQKTCRNSFSNANLERAKKENMIEKTERQTATSLEQKALPAQSRPGVPAIHAARSIRAYRVFLGFNRRAAIFPAGSTLEVERIIRECAPLVNDNRLIGKLASGNMVAIQAKYHAKGLVGLYNQTAKLKLSLNSENDSLYERIDIKWLAFSELVTFINKNIEVEKPAVLKLSDVVEFCSSKLSELGGEHPDRINATRVKTPVLTAFPDPTTDAQGRDLIVVLSLEIGMSFLRLRIKTPRIFAKQRQPWL